MPCVITHHTCHVCHQVFHAMSGGGLPRDAITYSALISALAKGRQWSLGECWLCRLVVGWLVAAVGWCQWMNIDQIGVLGLGAC